MWSLRRVVPVQSAPPRWILDVVTLPKREFAHNRVLGGKQSWGVAFMLQIWSASLKFRFCFFVIVCGWMRGWPIPRVLNPSRYCLWNVFCVCSFVLRRKLSSIFAFLYRDTYSNFYLLTYWADQLYRPAVHEVGNASESNGVQKHGRLEYRTLT